MAVSTHAIAVAWVAREDLKHYRITEGTIGVVERAFDAFDKVASDGANEF